MKREKLSRNKFVGLAFGIVWLLATRDLLYASRLRGDRYVNTAKLRQDYTLKLLKKLCTDIGPKPAGSRAYARGAKIILREMRYSLPIVSYNRFTFERWELINSSPLVVDGQNIEALPRYGGEGTSEDGIAGVLQKANSGFSIADAITGEIKALISVSQYGKAIIGGQPRTNPPGLPSFSVGKQDVPLLERAVENKLPSWIRAHVRFIPQSKGINVVGHLPGKIADEILFIAHADTVYNTPGANDNIASVIVMIMLAHAAAARGCNHTLTFIASDCEEYGYLGAKSYAEKRLSEGSMNKIRYVINFDSLTYGPNLWISSKDEQIKDLIAGIYKDLNIHGTPILDNKDGYVMDSFPFRPSGAKALHANSRGYDEKTLPVYHRPDDTANNVPLDCVEIGFRVFDEFIRRIDQN